MKISTNKTELTKLHPCKSGFELFVNKFGENEASDFQRKTKTPQLSTVLVKFSQSGNQFGPALGSPNWSALLAALLAALAASAEELRQSTMLEF